MNKEHILKNNYDFQRIIKNNSPFRYKDFILYIEKTTDSNYHFGFSVGKKLGHAVIRNKLKRQLKNIVNKKDYQIGFNCIIIVGSNVLNKSFTELQNDLIQALSKLSLIKENNDEKH